MLASYHQIQAHLWMHLSNISAGCGGPAHVSCFGFIAATSAACGVHAAGIGIRGAAPRDEGAPLVTRGRRPKLVRSSCNPPVVLYRSRTGTALGSCGMHLGRHCMFRNVILQQPQNDGSVMPLSSLLGCTPPSPGWGRTLSNEFSMCCW